MLPTTVVAYQIKKYVNMCLLSTFNSMHIRVNKFDKLHEYCFYKLWYFWCHF